MCGLPASTERRLVAIAGPPGAGKTTVARLAQSALENRGVSTGLLAMDGFHLDNAVLSQRGMLARKGAPETFDVAGFRSILDRLRSEAEVAVPEFDRTSDQVIAARSIVRSDQKTVIVEGNYLLLDEPVWRDLEQQWAHAVFLDVPFEKLEERLIQRWLDHGLPPDAARVRALENDIPNARRVVENLNGHFIRLGGD
ncbi:MAG: AAA family ATPase [Cyanobacteria bacterium P01_F01_bin.153]